MAKEDLKPVQSKEEAKERGRKGGIASGKARREKKLLKDTLMALLELKDKKGVSGQDNICIALYKRATNGDTKAFEIIRDTVGQGVQQKVQVENVPIIKDNL